MSRVEEVPAADAAAMVKFLHLRTLDGERTEWEVYLDWFWSQEVDKLHGPGTSAAIDAAYSDGSLFGE
jgi:hypothetical protein